MVDGLYVNPVWVAEAWERNTCGWCLNGLQVSWNHGVFLRKYLLISWRWFITIAFHGMCALVACHGTYVIWNYPSILRVAVVVPLKQWSVYFVDKLTFSDILAIIAPCNDSLLALCRTTSHFAWNAGFGKMLNIVDLACLNRETASQGMSNFRLSLHFLMLCSSTLMFNPDLVFSTSF